MEAEPCPFCRVADGGEEAASLVHGNEHTLTVPALHQRGRNRPHLLVITRTHVRDLTRLPAQATGAVMDALVVAARALVAVGAEGTTVIQHNDAAGGQDVFQVHFHVIARYRDDGFYRSPQPWPNGMTHVSLTERLEQADLIRNAVTARDR